VSVSLCPFTACSGGAENAGLENDGLEFAELAI